MILTIITPSYNRAYCLPHIYHALLANNREDFEWILVDDGSVDGTEALANEWTRKNEINFRYYKLENGGKAYALYNGFKNKPRGRFTLVLDSDDYLETNIIDFFKAELLKLEPGYIGLVGLKSDTKGNIIGSKFNYESGTYLDIYYSKKSSTGDKLFIIATQLYAAHIRLPLQGEKMLPDSIVYISLVDKGRFKFYNKIFYKGDYLEDGWSSNIVQILRKNINGVILEKKLLQQLPLYFKHDILNNIKYIYYSLISKKRFVEIVKSSNNRLYSVLLYFFGWLYFMKNHNKTYKN